MSRKLPAPLAWLRVKEGILYIRLKHGVNLADASPEYSITKAHTQVLLIHGDADDETNPENSKRVARANPRYASLWLVLGAKHTGAYAADPEAFETRVLDWFDRATR